MLFLVVILAALVQGLSSQEDDRQVELIINSNIVLKIATIQMFYHYHKYADK